MAPLPVRLRPGQDLRHALQALLAEHGVEAAFVLQGIGSLDGAQLRYAGAAQASWVAGDLEILSLAGTLSAQACHLHMTIADAQGRVQGGHVAPGCLVRTTAEILLMLLPRHQFSRAPDPVTGFDELTVRPRP
ncbi:MAG: PPC domain-containing DNA-binding protein [Pseudomonadota bacterium]